MIQLKLKPRLSPSELKQLRQLTGKALGEIKQAAQSNKALIEIEPFCPDWQTQRILLAALSITLSENSAAPFYILYDGDRLDTKAFRTLLEDFQQQERDDECNRQLENGEINTPDEYEATEPPWI